MPITPYQGYVAAKATTALSGLKPEWAKDSTMPPSERAKLIDRDNRDSFAGPLRTMHADRKTVFVDQLKWDLAVTDNLFEIDEYDTEGTIYLMVQDQATGGHLGSVRLLPSDGPHLLADKFAHLCEAGVPRGPDTCEITRMVTHPGLPRDAAERVR
jgi:N-acyl-L-homoserine lactone synthetase